MWLENALLFRQCGKYLTPLQQAATITKNKSVEMNGWQYTDVILYESNTK